MAKLAARLPDNVPGQFYVDSSCIDCATCRILAPETFAVSRAEDASVVRRQPADDAGRLRALMALVACPTASIGTVEKLDAAPGVRAFPEPIGPGEPVSFCGFTAESSFGAWSWLLARPEGNVLVDSPRAAGPLLRRLEELGGVARLFLTHRDDVADHAKLRARFGCARILHRDDVSTGTRDVERLLEGRAPVALAADLLAIPVPGHTRGSAALLFRGRYLFTGDHLWWDSGDGHLHASRAVCWYSWAEQTESMERLRALAEDAPIEWVLPGHGEPWHAPSPAALRAELARVVDRMRARR